MDNQITAPDGAERDKQEAYAKETEFFETVNGVGHTLYNRRAYAAAASLFRRAALSRPDNGNYVTNYGSSLWQIGRYDEALQVLERQVKQWPGYDDGRDNYGKVLTSFERYDEADEQFTTVLNRAPDRVNTRMQRAFCRLDRGDWKGGLEDYEARLPLREYQQFPPPIKTWNGEDLNGKVLYVQAEQGAGDTFLFSRYLYWVKSQWPACTIKFCCDVRILKPLWFYVTQGIVEFLPEGATWEDAKIDYAIYLTSLARIHGSRPDHVPTDPGLIEERCSKVDFTLYKPEWGNPLQIGVCWSGNPEMKENDRRSVPVDKFIRLAGDPRYLLYSFQVGDQARNQMLSQHGNEAMCDIAQLISPPYGFVETAAAMIKLDLVITVCTVTAHLAGCMGVPTWLLLAKEPHWYWGRKGETTMWYPSMRLFRQLEFGNWDSVFYKVESELAKLYETI